MGKVTLLFLDVSFQPLGDLVHGEFVFGDGDQELEFDLVGGRDV